mmetsp:Transcript_108992/g.216471  ORF Transcript_108992/g.216471 Transcript_108992/m.216471 type:complete len:84 (+) Transcript_108992:202-453(+)
MVPFVELLAALPTSECKAGVDSVLRQRQLRVVELVRGKTPVEGVALQCRDGIRVLTPEGDASRLLLGTTSSIPAAPPNLVAGR